MGNSILNRAYADFENPLFKYTTEKVLKMIKNNQLTFEDMDKPLIIYWIKFLKHNRSVRKPPGVRGALNGNVAVAFMSVDKSKNGRF